MADIQPNRQGKVIQAQKRLKRHQRWMNNQWDSATPAQRENFQKRLNLTMIHLAMVQSNKFEDIE